MSESLGELRDKLTQLPDRDRYALAVAAFYAGEIDDKDFVSLTDSVDGEVPLCVKPEETEQGYVQPDYVTHPGSLKSTMGRGSDGISNGDHHTYACELVGKGFDPVGRGYWRDPNDEPY